MDNQITVSSALENGVCTITLNRPRANAFNLEMISAAQKAVQTAGGNPQVRVVVLIGSGAAFSAGQDVGEIEKVQGSQISIRQHLLETYNPLVLQLRRLEKPVIAAIHGVAAGAGLGVALACDLRIAADNARFGLPVARLGFLITYPQMQRFVQMFGASVVSDLLLTARLLDAPQALAAGLCSQVHPLATIDDAVLHLAQTMTRLSPLTQRWHKAMLQTVLHKPDLSQLTDAEIAVVDGMFDSADYAEGVRAFVEKRSPRF